MIELIRLDERLIHGQVAAKWMKVLDTDRIIVADDYSASDSISRKTLMMAAEGTGKKTVIKSIKDTLTILNDPRCVNLKVFVITANVEDVKKIIDGVDHATVKGINIGNYGIIKESLSPRKQYYDRMYLNETEYAVMKEISESGIECYYQKTPETNKVFVKDVL